MVVIASGKTFYLETFGCQMNVHASEKVIGTLVHEGYAQVQVEEDADLILYNTCSIRDKAEQKVFNRLNDYKKLHEQGKRFGVLLRRAAGRREDFRARSVCVAGFGIRLLPEAPGDDRKPRDGETRITGLDDRKTDETFETEFTTRTNPGSRGFQKPLS